MELISNIGGAERFSDVHGIHDPVLSMDRGFEETFGIDDWSGWLEEGIDGDIIMSIRRNTNTGWPTGSEDFVKRLEGMLGRRLTRQSPGEEA